MSESPISFWLLIRRSLGFHARAHLGVVLGATIGSAALIGALLVGDSVRGSLRQHALDRLQQVEYAMPTMDRFFRADLAQRIGASDPTNVSQPRADSVVGQILGFNSASALQLPGTVSRQDAKARANRVNVIGIDLGTWSLVALGQRGSGSPPADRQLAEAGFSPEIMNRWRAGELVVMNQALATQLGVSRGDEVILRVRKPSQLAGDAVITPRDSTSLAIRLQVGPVLPANLLGNFGLMANQSTPANAFLPLNFLSEKVELAGRANLLLNGPIPSPGTNSVLVPDRDSFNQPSAEIQFLASRLNQNWALEDAQLTVLTIEQPQKATGGELVPPFVQVSSDRIFLESNVISAALNTLPPRNGSGLGDRSRGLASTGLTTNATAILTYLANLVRLHDRATPYSMITAASRPIIPAGMADDEILINQWLADDLQAKPGDSLEVSYYVVDSGSRLAERTNSFKVRAIVPLAGKYADRTLMPEFPGVSKAESTQDWDTGFPLIYKIRDKDEAYWRQYRGTPKAFVTLSAGQAMWSSRFGSLTAIRYEVPSNSSVQALRNLVDSNLLVQLNPGELGLRFQPVQEQALLAAGQSQDFGQLFIAFSVFLVTAALLLMAILFQFSLDQRQAEVGTFLALGFQPKQVRRLLLGEGVMLALVGGVLGALLGLVYAKAMLWGLATLWREAVGGALLSFHASASSLIIGTFSGALVATVTIWLALRRQARQPARELLASEPASIRTGTGRVAAWIAVASASGGLLAVGYAVWTGKTADPEVFFEAGALLLLAGLAATAWWLSLMGLRFASKRLSLGALGLRACARRRKRSVATVALLACGCFVIVSIGVFRLDANQDAQKRSSGTGGFSLIGESALPIVQDLNTESGRQFFGLSPNDFAAVSVVPFRLRDGDEASCLNLNRAQRPRLLGVDPERLVGRFTFTEAAKGLDFRDGWKLLQTRGQFPGEEIPAIGDANSIEWALGKKLGDTIEYTDENGTTFRLRLVGAVANSILQGSLIVDEAAFVKRFPGESGYRYFLLDTPVASTASVSTTLARALQDQGLQLTLAVRRLDDFNAVQNTYLGTFQILGGLGLLLGSAGLGVVVLRNVLERRGELALLTAVGFRKQALFRLVLAEHAGLLALGLGLGILAAGIAVIPAMLSPARQLPFLSLGVTLSAVMVNGLIWTWFATRIALRGNLLSALRNE